MSVAENPDHPLGAGTDAVRDLFAAITGWEGPPWPGVPHPLLPTARRAPGDGVRLQLLLGAPYEGNRGQIHGGFLSTALDMAGSVAARERIPGAVTRSLNVRFLRPSPLGRVQIDATVSTSTPLLADVEMTAWCGDVVTCRATAEFAHPDPISGRRA